MNRRDSGVSSATFILFFIVLTALAAFSCFAGTTFSFNDGIPDSWRLQYFGPNAGSNPQATATADPDGDGLNNYQEFLAGTDPLDATSFKKVPVFVTTFSGENDASQDGPYSMAAFSWPGGLAFAPDGKLWICEIGAAGQRIRVMDQSGYVMTLAGTNQVGFADGLGAVARFNRPSSIAFDHAGNAYVADLLNNRIRKITPQGLVSTFAGSAQGYVDGSADAAQFNQPYSVCVDSSDNVFVADFGNVRVRKITPDGTVSTYAGNGVGNLNGDRLTALFNSPNAVVVGADGTLYVSDWSNGQIRKIDASGQVSTLASGLRYLELLSLGSDGSIYAKVGGSAERLIKFDLSGNVIWSIDYTVGLQNGPVSTARFSQYADTPLSIPAGFILPKDDLLFADVLNNRLCVITNAPVPLTTATPLPGIFTNGVNVSLASPVTNGVMRYTLDGSMPDVGASAYSTPILVTGTADLKVRVFVNGTPVSAVYDFAYQIVSVASPVIGTQPQNQSVAIGQTLNLSVSVTGSNPLTFQWRKAQSPVQFATNTTFSIASAQLTDAGQYDVVISNSFGVVTSSVATVTVATQVSSSAPSGLVSWWPAENSFDDAIGGNVGAPIGGVSFVSGKVGNAFKFNGTDSGVMIPASTNLNVGVGDGITIDAWINTSDVATQQPIIEWADGANNIGVNFWICVGGIYGSGNGSIIVNFVDVNGSFHIVKSAAGVLTPNTFHHVAVTYDHASGLARLYLNGAKVSETNLGNFTPLTTTPVYIGKRSPGGNTYDFKGAIDEVDLFNRALTGDEIQTIYNSGSAGKTPFVAPPSFTQQPNGSTVFVGDSFTLQSAAIGGTPLHYQWALGSDSISGATNPVYSVGSAQSGDAGNYRVIVSNASGSITSVVASVTVTPLASVATPAGLVSWWRAENNFEDAIGGNRGNAMGGVGFDVGRVGSAFKFNGADSGVFIPASTNLNVGVGDGLTMDAWINTPDVSTQEPIAEWSDGNGNIGVNFWVGVGSIYGHGSGSFIANLLDVDGNFHILASPAGLIAPNAFYHVAFSYDRASGVGRLYLNGVVVVESNLGSFIPATNYPLILGSRAPGGYTLAFRGVIDEVDLFNRALSPGEVVSIYNARSAGKTPRFDRPSLILQPSDQTVIAGNAASFQASAIGGTPLSYQWQFKGTNVVGETNTVLLLSNVQPINLGDYRVIVANTAGSVTSQVARLTAYYHLNVTTNGNGHVTVDPSADSYAYNSTVTLTAVPDSGFVFSGWGGDAASAVNPLIVLVNAQKSIIANFHDGAAPVVAINSPGAGNSLTNTVTVAGTASDNLGVTSLRLELNGQAAGYLTLNGQNFSTNGIVLQRGTNVVRVIAADAYGNEGSAQVTLNWNPGCILSLIKPSAKQEGSTISIPVQLTSDGSIGGMSFNVNYDTNYLTLTGFTWANVVASALDQVNTNSPGILKATFALPATTVQAGTRTIATAMFRERSVPQTLDTTLVPVILDLSDSSGNPLNTSRDVDSATAHITIRRVVGDNNANNRLDIGDATVIQGLLTGLTGVRSWDVTGNDLNQNSALDSGDVIRVLRVVAGLDPQPTLSSADGVSGLSGQTLRVGRSLSGLILTTVGADATPAALLTPDRASVQPGDLVTLSVNLQGLTNQITGVSYTLDYPTNALRLLNTSSYTAGSLIPGSATTIWNVTPNQNNFITQTGRVLMASSSASAWPQTNGVLAQFTFQVQNGAPVRYLWPVTISSIEVSVNGYDNLLLLGSQTAIIGRAPNRATDGPVPPNTDANGFNSSFNGEIGVPYLIESSDDLVNWAPFVTITNFTGTWNFSDPSITNTAHRFYRAKQLQ